jgi:hypothetical protein
MPDKTKAKKTVNKPVAKPAAHGKSSQGKKVAKKTGKPQTRKAKGGAQSDNYGLFTPMKDIANLRDLSYNKPFKYADITPVMGVPLSNFALY